jgi:hypothetical protein
MFCPRLDVSLSCAMSDVCLETKRPQGVAVACSWPIKHCNFSVIEVEISCASSTTGGSHCCTGASARVETNDPACVRFTAILACTTTPSPEITSLMRDFATVGNFYKSLNTCSKFPYAHISSKEHYSSQEYPHSVRTLRNIGFPQRMILTSAFSLPYLFVPCSSPY